MLVAAQLILLMKIKHAGEAHVTQSQARVTQASVLCNFRVDFQPTADCFTLIGKSHRCDEREHSTKLGAEKLMENLVHLAYTDMLLNVA